MTIFETVGFTEHTINDAVVLAEYAMSNAVRRSCIDNTVNKRVNPGLLGANTPDVRAGMRLLALLASAITVGLKRRAQARMT